MKKLIPIVFALICMVISPVFAQSKPDLPADSRIKIFTYTPEDVYTIITKYGYQTSVSFAPNEEISTISVGDRSMWQIVPSGNRIFIRPMDEGLTTNMTVITNIREYTFDIKSTEGKDKNNLYVVQFRYPELSATQAEDETSANKVMLKPAPSQAGNVSIPTLDTQRDKVINEKYTYTGPDAVAPARVYDDGKYTYVEYDAMPSPAPIPYVVGPSGKAAVAKHKVKGNTMVIATASSGFVLKSAGGDITVYNELFHN